MWLSLLPALLLASPATQTAPDLAVRADHLVLGDGTRVENGVLLVTDGKIAAAGDVAIPDGTPTVRHEGFVSPGMVALDARLAAPGEAVDTTHPFLEDAELRFGFDPHQPRVRAALEGGVTTALLAPSPTVVVGGRTAVVKTHRGEVLRPDAHLGISMRASATDARRAPTSYGGMVAELSARLEAGDGVWGELTAGQRLAHVQVDDRHEVMRAVELGGRHGMRGLLVGASLFGELLEHLDGSGFALVLPAYGLGDASGRTLASTAAVSLGSLPFAYSLRDPNQFRFPAAAALREGGDPAALERAFFSGAATLALVGDRVGSLKSGLDADFVLWSGDPLALTSRVDAVYVGGQRVYHRADDTAASNR